MQVNFTDPEFEKRYRAAIDTLISRLPDPLDPFLQEVIPIYDDRWETFAELTFDPSDGPGVVGPATKVEWGLYDSSVKVPLSRLVDCIEEATTLTTNEAGNMAMGETRSYLGCRPSNLQSRSIVAVHSYEMEMVKGELAKGDGVSVRLVRSLTPGDILRMWSEGTHFVKDLDETDCYILVTHPPGTPEEQLDSIANAFMFEIASTLGLALGPRQFVGLDSGLLYYEDHVPSEYRRATVDTSVPRIFGLLTGTGVAT